MNYITIVPKNENFKWSMQQSNKVINKGLYICLSITGQDIWCRRWLQCQQCPEHWKKYTGDDIRATCDVV